MLKDVVKLIQVNPFSYHFVTHFIKTDQSEKTVKLLQELCPVHNVRRKMYFQYIKVLILNFQEGKNIRMLFFLLLLFFTD